MKKSLLAIAMMLGAGAASAQYYSVSATDIGFNPGNLHLEQEQPPAFMTANYTGYTQILSSGGTQWSTVQSIPFTFEFNGAVVTSYKVSPSGVVTFSTGAVAVPSSNNVALPDSEIPDNSICAWGLNIGGANDGVVIKTFGTAPRRQQWIIWASASESSLLGTSVWSNWGIVLEESTNHVYVVDMRTYASGGGNNSLTVGIQIDTNEAYQLAASPNVTSNTLATSGNGSDPSDNTYYLFGYGTQPNTDIDNIMVTNNYYIEVNQATSITGLIVNHGSANITSAQIQYTAGSANVTDNVASLNIAPGTAYEFTLPTAWTPSVEGFETIETTVLQSNGNAEVITVNNTTSKDVWVHPTPVLRKPLLEQFTSSTCAPCTPGNANVLAVMSNFSGQYSKVNYQMSWPGNGDPYYTLEGLDRRTFYGVNSVPSMHTDGSLGLNSNSFTASVFTDAKAAPAFINMSVEGTLQAEYEYAVQNGSLVIVDSVFHVTATVAISPVIDIASGLKAHISINENLTYNNVETNGETEFHDVMKKMLPDAGGTTLPALTEGDTNYVSASHTFVGEYRLPADATDPINHSSEHSIEEWDDLRAVAWVQNPVNGEVWQSENANVVVLPSISNKQDTVIDGQTVVIVDGEEWVMWDDKYVPLGVEGSVADLISLFPNPANDVLTISGTTGDVKVAIYDATGRLVVSTVVSNNTLDVSNLEAGIYNISIENNGVNKVEKVTIVH